MMEKQSQIRKITRKPWLLVGLLLSVTIIGVSGCGTKAVTTSTATTSTSTADESATQTAKKPTRNPAIEAAMEIRTLQGNEQMVLTTDQKAIIKPILQTLIDTASPSEDFLQQKADAILAVFTDAQKTYLSTNTSKGKPDGNSQKGQEAAKDQTEGENRAPKVDQTAPSGQSQDLFKQVLAALT